tara:strand:- start:925 stop:1161 length:237 start_codon:yes stop_codon:yes gene_type:complete
MKLMHQYVTGLCRQPLDCWYEWDGGEAAVLEGGVVVEPAVAEQVILVEVWVGGVDVFEIISDDLKEVIEIAIREDIYQ